MCWSDGNRGSKLCEGWDRACVHLRVQQPFRVGWRGLTREVAPGQTWRSSSPPSYHALCHNTVFVCIWITLLEHFQQMKLYVQRPQEGPVLCAVCTARRPVSPVVGVRIVDKVGSWWRGMQIKYCFLVLVPMWLPISQSQDSVWPQAVEYHYLVFLAN